MNSLKEIIDIVFVKYTGDLNRVETAVFYSDGSKKHLTYEDGLKEVAKLARQRGINSKEALRGLINNELVHVMTINKFYVDYAKFFESTVSEEEIKDVIDDEVQGLVIEEEPIEESNTYVLAKEKDNSLKYKLAAGGLAIALLAAGTTYALSKDKTNTKAFNLHNNKETSQDAEINDNNLVEQNNEFYENYSFDQLQKVTQNQTQKAEMKRIHDALVEYNVNFADEYEEQVEDEKTGEVITVRPALSWDEMIALSQAYNDFTPNEIKAIFNGTTVRSSDLMASYKSATLQLMGAYVIEDKDYPVDMSTIIIDEEGKDFYNRIHKLFLDAQEATGDEKVSAVEEFYRVIRDEFPISPELREEGISHSEVHDSITSYKLSVVPMVAAAEIMWQDLEIDSTLKGGVNNYFLDFINLDGMTKEDLMLLLRNSEDGVVYGEIDYFDDLGLCNVAKDKYEIAQQITMGDCGNFTKTNPLYEQYKNATIKELKEKDAYVIDDVHRDLSRSVSFKEKVDHWRVDTNEEANYTGNVSYTSETTTKTKSWTKTKRKTTTKTRVIKKAIPADEKEKIDKEIEKENKKAKEKGEKKAEENRQQMQHEEDKKAEEIKKEVEDEEKDMQDKIDQANEQIKENNKDNDTSTNTSNDNTTNPSSGTANDTPVNEKDFGDHNVDFDDNHSDSQGNLDDSVENITTDGTGAHEAGDPETGANLPDPEDTAKDFEERTKDQVKESEKAAPKKETASAPKQESAPEPKKESAPAPKQESAPEPKKESTPAPKQDSAPVQSSNEAAVDKYVEELANTSDKDDSEKTLVKE